MPVTKIANVKTFLGKVRGWFTPRPGVKPTIPKPKVVKTAVVETSPSGPPLDPPKTVAIASGFEEESPKTCPSITGDSSSSSNSGELPLANAMESSQLGPMDQSEVLPSGQILVPSEFENEDGLLLQCACLPLKQISIWFLGLTGVSIAGFTLYNFIQNRQTLAVRQNVQKTLQKHNIDMHEQI